MPDGTIQDDGIAISGLNVDKNGVMTLQVDDQLVELGSGDVIFGDSGIEVKGYTFNKETGEWHPALTPEQQAIKALPETELFNLSYETKDLSVEIAPDMTLTTRIVTDESGGPTVAEVRINPTWPDVEKAIPEFSFAMLAKVATHTGGPEGTGIDVDLETYAKMLSEAKDGTRPWSDVGITLKKIYMAGSDTPVDVVIAPAAGDSVLPENMYPVNEVVFVMGGEFKGVGEMTSTNEGSVTNRSVLNGSTLYLYIGINKSVDREIRGQADVLVEGMAQVMEFLWKANTHPKVNYELANLLRKAGGKSGWAALQVFDASGKMNETERLTNHP